MAKVDFKNLTKKYGNFVAIKDFNLNVADHEFLCLVGPSGCGKTTCLRMLAGLEEVTDGEIYINEQVVNSVEPKNRDIAMVFQSYALYPHYSVYNNLAFGLRTQSKMGFASKLISLLVLLFYLLIIFAFWAIGQFFNLIMPQFGTALFNSAVIGFLILLIVYEDFRNGIRNKIIVLTQTRIKMIGDFMKEEESIKTKIHETAKLLGIEEQLEKKPKQLSGGQRQRVALGRAIIRNPKVFLMDEPLSNLDAKLRVQMRAELQRLTRKLQVTTIYVTHDQIEAMTLGDRIAVLNLGVLQQVGTPDEVYMHPINKFVAGFIGSPAMNFVYGQIQLQNEKLILATKHFNYQIPPRYQSLSKYINQEIILGIRPEHISLNHDSSQSNAISIKIGVLEPIGSDTFIYIDFSENLTFIVKMEGLPQFELDQVAMAHFDDAQIHFFEAKTEKRILPADEELK